MYRYKWSWLTVVELSIVQDHTKPYLEPLNNRIKIVCKSCSTRDKPCLSEYTCVSVIYSYGWSPIFVKPFSHKTRLGILFPYVIHVLGYMRVDWYDRVVCSNRTFFTQFMYSSLTRAPGMLSLLSSCIPLSPERRGCFLYSVHVFPSHQSAGDAFFTQFTYSSLTRAPGMLSLLSSCIPLSPKRQGFFQQFHKNNNRFHSNFVYVKNMMLCNEIVN